MCIELRVTSTECYISNAPHTYRRDPSKSLGTGKFHSMTNDKNFSRRPLRLVESSIGYSRDTFIPFFSLLL